MAHGGVHARGYMRGSGMHDRGHAWQVACMVRACVA